MASRQGSGEAAVGVVVLLGQIFSIVLTLAAVSSVLARELAAWRAGCASDGLCCWMGFSGSTLNNGVSRSQQRHWQLLRA